MGLSIAVLLNSMQVTIHKGVTCTGSSTLKHFLKDALINVPDGLEKLKQCLVNRK